MNIYQIMAEAQRQCPSAKHFDSAKWEQEKADRDNEREGSLKGYDCRKCRNKGYIVFVENGEQIQRNCECKKMRDSLNRIKESGLEKPIQEKRFDNFIVSNSLQECMLKTAQSYVASDGARWFFIGGQSGAGKSHLCTAICGELLKQNKQVRYMKWREIITQLKALANSPERSQRIAEWKNADVLYIDDFLKVQHGQQPTRADVDTAFELLDYRCESGSPTIISSEYKLWEIEKIDTALCGRIAEQATNDYIITINENPAHNYRLKNK